MHWTNYYDGDLFVLINTFFSYNLIYIYDILFSVYNCQGESLGRGIMIEKPVFPDHLRLKNDFYPHRVIHTFRLDLSYVY